MYTFDIPLSDVFQNRQQQILIPNAPPAMSYLFKKIFLDTVKTKTMQSNTK